MTFANLTRSPRALIRGRIASESGFAMVVALGVLTVTSLLIAAIYVGVTADVQATARDTNVKQAYYAARAGENAFLYQLNQNPDYWSTCSNDYQPTPVTVPGSSTGVKYSFLPVYNSGYGNSNCTATNAVSALIDSHSGTLRIVFTGYAGPTNSTGVPKVTRSIVASFRRPSPLDFLWYTDHEMKDPVLDPANCTGEKYYWQYSPSPPSTIANNCEINWASGDRMYGPVYTNDQYLVSTNASPVFGRPGVSTDKIETSAPTSSVCVSSNCYGATFPGGGAQPQAQSVPLPTTSTQLQADAIAHGQVFTGTTTIALNGGSATISNCPGTTSTVACTTGWLNTTQPSYSPIIYVQNGLGCTPNHLPSTYSTNSSGQYFGACGDVYVHGSYNQPLTIVSDDDIIVVGNTSTGTCYTPTTACTANPGITTTTDGAGNPTGTATVGLVAGSFVRVMHPANAIPQPVTIDAAILTLQHSFMVDNFTAGASSPQPYLNVHGAVDQRYRGAVGQVGSNGYLKSYNYDDRLHVLLPPYLFSLSTAGWDVSRETLCMPNSTDYSNCSYNGP
jgi:hypothetical protein